MNLQWFKPLSFMRLSSCFLFHLFFPFMFFIDCVLLVDYIFYSASVLHYVGFQACFFSLAWILRSNSVSISCYVQEYASYLDASRITNMSASDRAVTAHNVHSLWCEPGAGGWVKRWLHCSGLILSVSRCLTSEVDCPLVCCYEDVEYVKDLSTVVRRFDVQALLEIGLFLVVLCCPIIHLYFGSAWIIGPMNATLSFVFVFMRGIFAGWHNFELFAIPPSHRWTQYIEDLGWWGGLEGSCVLCVLTPAFFEYFLAIF